MVRHLPADSATAAALTGMPREWGVAEELLAQIVDQAAAGNFMFASLHGKRRPQPPTPVPRPGRVEPHPHPADRGREPRRKLASPDELMAFLRKHG